MNCNYCNSAKNHVITEYTRLEKNNILQCNECGLVFLELKSGESDIESFYTSEYRKQSELPVLSPDEFHNYNVTVHDAKSRLDFIQKVVKLKGKKILEIGSATGRLLEELQNQGADEVSGIELGDEYAQFASARGIDTQTKSLEKLGYKDEYDVVICFHTLEHVYDPNQQLSAVYKALKNKGSFIGEVPNQDDWRLKIFNDEIIKRFHYDRNHYYYFSPETLTNYLKKGGFSDIQLETVERYNSLIQLRNILCSRKQDQDIEEVLNRYIFPKDEKADVRLPDPEDTIESEFNKLFARAVNSELIGNCLRWIACKNM